MSDSTDNHTPRHAIRVEEYLWAEFGRLVGARNRSSLVRDFIRWYVSEPGAELPARPGDADLRDELLETKNKLRVIRNKVVHADQKVSISPNKDEALDPLEFRLLLSMADEISEVELAARLEVPSTAVRGHIRRLAAKIDAVGEVKIWVPDDPLFRRPADG
ncbi:hypothetical protein [Streptosporangium sp. V21-05]|uniref:hypothetical protein n=1 Tax=Streptosporangium sp. V21-05 TaxID=3446115 RepID=UPI003F53835C